MPNGFPLLLRSQLRTESASALLSAAVATLRQLPALDVRQRLARLCGQRPARLCGMQTAQSACHRLAAAPTPAAPPLPPPPMSRHAPAPRLLCDGRAWRMVRPATNYDNGTDSQCVASAVALAAVPCAAVASFAAVAPRAAVATSAVRGASS